MSFSFSVVLELQDKYNVLIEKMMAKFQEWTTLFINSHNIWFYGLGFFQNIQPNQCIVFLLFLGTN